MLTTAPVAIEPKKDDIIYNSWGYDQTNIDFYKILKVGKKFVTVIKLSAWTKEEGFMQGPTAPLEPHVQEGEPERHSWKLLSDGKLYFRFEYGAGWIWDGKPVRCSWYA